MNVNFDDTQAHARAQARTLTHARAHTHKEIGEIPETSNPNDD